MPADKKPNGAAFGAAHGEYPQTRQEEGRIMAFLSSAQRSCNARNRKARNVSESMGSLSLDRYWEASARNNFLITGGGTGVRSSALLRALPYLAAGGPGQTIVLNACPTFQQMAMQQASQNRLGRVVFSDPNNRNYDPFYGLPTTASRTVFEAAAKRRGYDSGAVADYARAFLQVLSKNRASGLYMMRELESRGEQRIREIGANVGVDAGTLLVFERANPGTRRDFRLLLEEFGEAFQGIMDTKPTGHNLIDSPESSGMRVIWTESPGQELFHAVLAAELKERLTANYGEQIRLILNGVQFDRDDPLWNQIVQYRDQGRLLLGLCYEDVISWARVSPDRANQLGNTPSMLVLKFGKEDPADLEESLKRFGNYRHYEANDALIVPPFALPGTAARNRGITSYDRPRVLIQEMEWYLVAARGDMGDTVGLYRGLK